MYLEHNQHRMLLTEIFMNMHYLALDALNTHIDTLAHINNHEYALFTLGNAKYLSSFDRK